MVIAGSICVLVLRSDAVLKRAVAGSMMREMKLDVVVSDAEDLETLDLDIAKTNPDALLLNDSLDLASGDQLISLLNNHSRLKIVLVRMASNRIHIFGQEEVLITGFDDLLANLDR